MVKQKKERWRPRILILVIRIKYWGIRIAMRNRIGRAARYVLEISPQRRKGRREKNAKERHFLCALCGLT